MYSYRFEHIEWPKSKDFSKIRFYFVEDYRNAIQVIERIPSLKNKLC